MDKSPTPPPAHLRWKMIVMAIFGVILGGCTVHPPGESAERSAAATAGRPFDARAEVREAPQLPDNPTPGQLVEYALRTNAGLEQKYWEWRSAIEQIPQDGTQPTNLALSAKLSIQRGRTDWGQATLAAGNDPMADIVLPPKLAAAAQRALQNARAAGLRFRKARLDLRAKVLAAWYDYALAAELIRLEQANGQLLKTIEMMTETRNGAGFVGQLDVLKARDEVELSNNDVAAMRAQLPAQRSALNALLNRPPDAPLAAPASLPPRSPFAYSDAEALARAIEVNPEMGAQLRDIDARRDGVTLARLQSLPDVSLGASTDLKGLAERRSPWSRCRPCATKRSTPRSPRRRRTFAPSKPRAARLGTISPPRSFPI